MTFRGRCGCGSVSAEIAGEASAVRQCWCRQCQKLAGGGATHNAMFGAADIVLSGGLAEHAYVAASGNTVTHSYCASCGTPVMARSSARPQFRTIRLGFLEPGHGLAPRMAIWTGDAPPWALIDPALDQFPGQPPAPVPAAT